MARFALLILSLTLLFSSCEVEFHPYDTRIEGERNINSRNIAPIEQATCDKREIRFAVISDTQRWYDETEAAVRALNKRSDLDFVLHTGDMADFGLRAEFERQRDLLNGLKVPYIALIGNHDCLATGEQIYREMFGPFNFCFTAGRVRFVCLNTNSLEFDHTESVPNLSFIEDELRHYPTTCEQTIVAMHASPRSEQFDRGMARAFQRHIAAFRGLQCCINGHGHSFSEKELFDDGVTYVACGNIEKRAYLLFTVNEQGYSYEKIAF